MAETAYKPIEGDLRKALDAAILRCLDLAVDSATAERDPWFLRWDAQLRGDPSWAGLKPRWQGACDAEDPITREHHLGYCAQGMQVYSSPDRYIVNATVPGDEEDASNLEIWANTLIPSYGLNSQVCYDLLYNAARHTYAILYAGWRQVYQTTYSPVYVDPATNRRVPAEARLPDVEYQEAEEGIESLVSEGFEFRVPHAADVTFWPPDAQSLDEAERIQERIYLSATDLLNGVDDLGYDAEAVRQVLAQGSDWMTGETHRAKRNEEDGLHGAPLDEDGLFEVFCVWGKPPVLLDENQQSRLTNAQRRRDYLWMIERKSGVVFKFGPSPYQCCPYVKFDCLREPGRMIGDGICSLLSSIQREATVSLRFRIDGRDVAMSPSLLIPQSIYDEFQRWKNYPGALFPYADSMGPGSIAPLEYDKSFFGAALQDSNDLRMRAAQMFSAEARATVTTNERTATEMAQAAAGFDQKADLFLTNFNQGWLDLWDVLVSHTLQFGMSEGGPQKMLAATKTITLNAEMLKKKYNVLVQGSSMAANPNTRLDRATKVYEFMGNNPLVQMQVQRGDYTGVWSVSERVLRDLGIRDPQTIIGPEPQKPPSADLILEQLAAAIQQFAQAGDPGAGQLMMMLQQMQASQIPTDNGAGGGQNPQRVSISMNYKDLQPGEQDQLAQMVGLTPGRSGSPEQRNGAMAQ